MRDAQGPPRHPQVTIKDPPRDLPEPHNAGNAIKTMVFQCFSKRPWGPPRHPRRVPWGSLGSPGGSLGSPRDAQGPPRDPPGTPRGIPGTPRDPPKTTQGIPREAPGMPRDPRVLPGIPRYLPGTPYGPPASPGHPQRSPRSPSEHTFTQLVAYRRSTSNSYTKHEAQVWPGGMREAIEYVYIYIYIHIWKSSNDS